MVMIRSYQTQDRDILTDIFRMNVPKYFDSNEEKDFIEYLVTYGDTYLVLEENQQIIGGSGYYFNDQDASGRITWIFFHPDYSGKGLGRMAVEYCLNQLKLDQQIRELIVTTSQHAFRFFEKFGYKVHYIEKDYWGKGLDLYEMKMQP